MRIKFPSAFVHKRSQILMLRSIPLLSWPREIQFFLFVHHFLTHSCLMFTEFPSASNWKQTSQCPASKRRTYFLWSKVFFFWLGEIKDIFQFCFIFTEGEKRKDNYRYLWQWIIVIFIITQPYKLCTKREIKVGMVFIQKVNVLLVCLVKVFMHSPTMVYVRSPSLIG